MVHVSSIQNYFFTYWQNQSVCVCIIQNCFIRTDKISPVSLVNKIEKPPARVNSNVKNYEFSAPWCYHLVHNFDKRYLNTLNHKKAQTLQVFHKITNKAQSLTPVDDWI